MEISHILWVKTSLGEGEMVKGQEADREGGTEGRWDPTEWWGEAGKQHRVGAPSRVGRAAGAGVGWLHLRTWCEERAGEEGREGVQSGDNEGRSPWGPEP